MGLTLLLVAGALGYLALTGVTTGLLVRLGQHLDELNGLDWQGLEDDDKMVIGFMGLIWPVTLACGIIALTVWLPWHLIAKPIANRPTRAQLRRELEREERRT